MNPSVAFCSAKLRSAGLVYDIMDQLLKLTCYDEDHRSLGGSIISRLDNGAFVGSIYSLLVLSYFHVEVVTPVTTKTTVHKNTDPNMRRLLETIFSYQYMCYKDNSFSMVATIGQA